MSCSDIIAKGHRGESWIQDNKKLELGGRHKVWRVAYSRSISMNYCARNNKCIVTIGIIVTIAHVWSGDDRSSRVEFQDMTLGYFMC